MGKIQLIWVNDERKKREIKRGIFEKAQICHALFYAYVYPQRQGAGSIFRAKNAQKISTLKPLTLLDFPNPYINDFS